jgi:YHS domain-containing protein
MLTFWIVVVAAVAIVGAYWLRPGSAALPRRRPFKSDARERDPVCGMDVDVAHAAGQHEYGGHIYWFCSTACKDRFDAKPDEYAKNRTAPPGAHGHGA